jgi:hypothetical protein
MQVVSPFIIVIQALAPILLLLCGPKELYAY